MFLTIKAIRAITLVCLTVFCMPATAQVERVSVGAAGEQAEGDSSQAAVSDDGQVVVFRSTATNIATKVNYIGNTFGYPNIFIQDLTAGTFEQASGTVQYSESDVRLYVTRNNFYPSVSDDGLIVVMQALLHTWGHNLVLYNRSSGIAFPLLAGNEWRYNVIGGRLEPVISGNGQVLALFGLPAMGSTNPIGSSAVQDDRNAANDVFVWERLAQPVVPMERVSRDALGVEGRGDSLSPSLSDNGRYVAFYSYADNLVANDTNDFEDIFVKDRQTAGIVIASVANDGTLGNGDSYKPIISGNGGFVVYRSRASNLVPNDNNGQWDIFVRDLTLSTTERVSVSSSGAEANHASFEAGISDDGRYVVFRSNASNLVAGDNNQRFDIFVHDRQTQQTERVSLSPSGEADGNSSSPVISGDGNWIIFESDATNLVAGDTNKSSDVFRVRNPLSSAP